MRKIMISSLLFIFLLAACTAGQGEVPDAATSGNEDEQEVQRQAIQLPMGFIPDPQYAPFYVAQERGYFEDAGFDVEFDYGFETDGMALVGAGELPFAIVSGEQVILARAQEIPVVYVMEWFQRFPIAIISKTAAGITEPGDLAGREVGLPGFFGASYVGYAGLLSESGLSEDDVLASDIGFTQVESLLTDKVEAVVGYANNEPLQLATAGEDVNVIYVADVTDMVANGIITNEMTIEENPEMVEAFLRATLRGLEDTLSDPEAAYEISKKYVEGLDDSRMNVLNASLELWQADTLGLTDKQSWQRTQEVLLEIGFLDRALEDLAAAYSNEFILAAQP